MTRRTFAGAAILPTFAAVLAAQAKKRYTFKGKIESINAAGKSMSINGENVEGWMAAMTMSYVVDNEDVFKTAKVGDMIEATVYDGDYKLYKAHLLASGQKK